MRFYKRSKGFIVLLVLSLIGLSKQSFAQTIRTNYVRTRIPQIPVTDTSKLDTIPVQRQAVSIEYSDGLGRSLQSIQVQGSAGLNDIIVPYVYDNMGRASTAYLPYAYQGTTAANAGTYRLAAPNGVLSFYNPASPGAPKIPTDAAPYAQTVYEASPLGRVNEQGEVGTVFQPGTGHTVRASYQVNSAADSINYYTIKEGVSVAKTPFATGVLTKTVVTDENGHRQALWKDLQGRPVTRTQLDAPTVFYSTDYVYNDLNQLADIIPPSAKKLLPASGFPQLAYIFHYDSIGRVVEKKIPGKGWIYTVYNHTDQPVLSQDSNMRAKNEWIFMKYDAEGRMVQTGVYFNTTVTGRRAMQHLCDTGFPTLWETWQPGVGYTNNAFPQQSAVPGATPLVIYATYYYDDYSFTEAASKPFQTNVYGTSPTLRTMGMATGVSTYILGTASQHLVIVNYYDKQNRLIQQLSDNHLGFVDVVNNQYNFIGELTGSQRIITPIADSTITIKDRYVNDPAGRLLDTYESIQGKPEVDISHNVYNEVDQKVREQLNASGNIFPGPIPSNIVENTTLTTGKNDYASASVKLNPGFSFTATSGNSYVAAIGTGSAQGQEFRYNIRGWLTSINNGTLTDDGITQTDPNSLFGESITYSEASPLAGATPQYNGNISGITWRNKIEQTGKPGVTTGGQGYAFTYDNVNRQTQTGYYTQTGSTFTKNTANALTENITGYDEMGNIQGLQRKDKTGNLLNNLTYIYQTLGNQLASISDAGSQNISGTFTYDGNGNMTSDSRKGITITYNYLDLPDTIKQGTSKLVFTYDAIGNKLYKQLIIGGTIISQRHYVEDAEVTATSSIAFDGKIESIAMDEGRILNPASANSQYEYYLQDHLFNNRVTFRPVTDSTLSLSMVQNYYPFGENMGDTTMNYNLSPLNQYKYNNNEWQPELNLNTYDFDSRHYDPILGGFLGIDPLADESEDGSPYNYVENNPMNLIDPDGMQYTVPTWKTGVTFTGGSGGSLFAQFGGWGGSAVSAANGFIGGVGAFNINKPVTSPSWSGLGKVQGNQNHVYSADVPPPTYNSKDPWYKKLGYYAYEIADGVLSPLNMAVDNVPKNPKVYVRAKREYNRNLANAFLTYGGGELVGRGLTIVGDLANPVAGRIVEKGTINLIGSSLRNVEDVFANPGLLESKSLSEIQNILKDSKGFEEGTLRKGRSTGKGWTLREPNSSGTNYTDRYIQYSPGSPRHFGGKPYWKVSSGTKGVLWFVAGQ